MATFPKADSRTQRESNRALVLEILGVAGAITRSELARCSALAKPTVAAIVDDLLASGLVRDLGPAPARTSAGPRGRLVALDPHARAFLGVHFGVHGTSLAIADATGKIRREVVIRSFHGDAAALLDELPRVASTLLEEAAVDWERLHGVGAAVPGLVEHKTGRCVFAPNLAWSDVPLRARLVEVFGIRANVRNSVQAAAIAEARVGVGKSVPSFAWLYIGSGVGAALVLDGKVFYGKRGYTGEIGHWPVVLGGVPCACGRRGCLETVASNEAIEALAARRWEKRHHRPTLMPYLNAAAVSAAADRGERFAQDAMDEVGEHLGEAVASLVNLLDIDLVVLDGDIIRAGSYVMGVVRASTTSHTLNAHPTHVVSSTVGADVMLRGAVFLAMERESVDRFVSNGPEDAPPWG
jgi:predicted NBD/HSP70 family sugar kinase